MFARYQSRISLVLIGMLLLQNVSGPVQAGFPDLFNNKGKKPQPVVMDAAMERLAKNLDWLESHINEYGSIAPKMPDVWGEARLTKHRQEYEEEMKKQLDQFQPTLQAAISRSDQAYFASALALQAAIQPQPRRVGGNSNNDNSTKVEVAIPEKPELSSLFADPEKVFVKDSLRNSTSFVAPGNGGISLEPTALLDQRSRYLNHLQQLRRINEGDDTADSPGYALNLVRIPVSVLPGSKTRKGHAAEITFTMKPYVSDELLPITFRQLVINDVVDTLGHPLLQAIFVKHKEYANAADIVALGNEKLALVSLIQNELKKVSELIQQSEMPNDKKLEEYKDQLFTQLVLIAGKHEAQAFSKEIDTRKYVELSSIESLYKTKNDFNKALNMMPLQSNLNNTADMGQKMKLLTSLTESDYKKVQKVIEDVNMKYDAVKNKEKGILESKGKIEIQIASIAASASGMRKGRFPVPPSQLQNVGRGGFLEPIINTNTTTKTYNNATQLVSNRTKKQEILPEPIQLDNQIALDLEAAIEAFANAFPDLKQGDSDDINDPSNTAKFGRNLLEICIGFSMKNLLLPTICYQFVILKLNKQYGTAKAVLSNVFHLQFD